MTENIEFDVDTVIKVLRQSGYHNQALDLSRKHNKHEDYLKIQLEDVKNFTEALSYMKQLDSADSVAIIKRYGKLMIEQIPMQTLDFLKALVKKIDRKIL
jgi:hypothetical protein